jgi:hypothetical protein
MGRLFSWDSFSKIKKRSPVFWATIFSGKKYWVVLYIGRLKNSSGHPFSKLSQTADEHFINKHFILFCVFHFANI